MAYGKRASGSRVAVRQWRVTNPDRTIRDVYSLEIQLGTDRRYAEMVRLLVERALPEILGDPSSVVYTENPQTLEKERVERIDREYRTEVWLQKFNAGLEERRSVLTPEERIELHLPPPPTS